MMNLKTALGIFLLLVALSAFVYVIALVSNKDAAARAAQQARASDAATCRYITNERVFPVRHWQMACVRYVITHGGTDDQAIRQCTIALPQPCLDGLSQ